MTTSVLTNSRGSWWRRKFINLSQFARTNLITSDDFVASNRNWILLLAKCDSRREAGDKQIHSIFSCFKNLNSINKRNWQSVPSDGGIIISLFNATLLARSRSFCCLLFVWVEKLIKNISSTTVYRHRRPCSSLHKPAIRRVTKAISIWWFLMAQDLPVRHGARKQLGPN